MLAIREHIVNSGNPEEARKNAEKLKICRRHFEEALRRVKPISQRELDMYERISKEFSKRVK